MGVKSSRALRCLTFASSLRTSEGFFMPSLFRSKKIATLAGRKKERRTT